MHSADIKNHLQLVMEELYRLGMPRTCAHFVAGGAIASLVLDEQPKDYDVWFGSLEDWNAATKGLNMACTRISKYSATYTLPSGNVVQLVRSRVGTPEKVVGTFDFQHTMSHYLPLTGELKVDEEFIKSKALTFVRGNLCHPVNTVQRLLKFSRRGYSINNKCIADIMNDVGIIYSDKFNQHVDADDGTEWTGNVFHPGWGGGGEEDSR